MMPRRRGEIMCLMIALPGILPRKDRYALQRSALLTDCSLVNNNYSSLAAFYGKKLYHN